MAQQLPVQVQALPQYRSLSSAAMPQALRQAHVIAPHPFCSASAVAAATAVDKQRLCVACEACHDRKLKCRMPENGDPCDACKLKDRVCEARVGRKRGRPRLARPFLPGMEFLVPGASMAFGMPPGMNPAVASMMHGQPGVASMTSVPAAYASSVPPSPIVSAVACPVGTAMPLGTMPCAVPTAMPTAVPTEGRFEQLPAAAAQQRNPPFAPTMHPTKLLRDPSISSTGGSPPPPASILHSSMPFAHGAASSYHLHGYRSLSMQADSHRTGSLPPSDPSSGGRQPLHFPSMPPSLLTLPLLQPPTQQQQHSTSPAAPPLHPAPLFNAAPFRIASAADLRIAATNSTAAPAAVPSAAVPLAAVPPAVVPPAAVPPAAVPPAAAPASAREFPMLASDAELLSCKDPETREAAQLLLGAGNALPLRDEGNPLRGGLP